MPTRILLAWFDDIRKGRKDIAMVQQLLVAFYQRDPARRGQLLHWLDLAQYEQPIPVTDYLILRKEVEAAMKDVKKQIRAEDATVIVGSAGPIAAEPVTPDAPTLVATVLTTRTAEATLVGDAATQPGSSSLTPLPERSDHVGLHDPADTLRPAEQDTVIVTPPPAPVHPAPRLSANLLPGIAAAAIAGTLGLTLALLWPAAAPTTPAPDTPHPAPALPEMAVTEPMPERVAAERLEPAPVAMTEATAAPAATPAAASVDLTRLDEPALQGELQRRLQQGQLLPQDAADSAHAILRELERRAPGEPHLQPRIALKNAHLHMSDQARQRGDWEAAQQHLDAAFQVLQQAVTE